MTVEGMDNEILRAVNDKLEKDMRLLRAEVAAEVRLRQATEKCLEAVESRGYARGITDAANAVWAPGAAISTDTCKLLADVAANIRQLVRGGGG